jgi:hypothetical protein
LASEYASAAQQIKNALSIADPSERNQQMEGLIASVGPDNVRSMQRYAKEVGFRSPDTAKFGADVNFRLGQLLGPEIVGLRDGNGPLDMGGVKTYVLDQFEGWMSADAAAAQQWIEGLSNTSFRTALWQSYEQRQKSRKPE